LLDFALLFLDIDVTIDGADEVSNDFNLVKGRGGALFREKMVEMNSEKLIIIVDESKIVNNLLDTPTSGLPVEIVPFCWETTLLRIQNIPNVQLKEIQLREARDGSVFVTDNGNFILDLFFEVLIFDILEYVF